MNTMTAPPAKQALKIAKRTVRFICQPLLAAIALASTALGTQTGPPNGQALYQSRCAMCHEMANTAPFMNRHVLKIMAPETIVSTLTTGMMREQGANLSAVERAAVAEFLTGKKI